MATYLPVAGVEVDLFELMLTACLTGFFGGIFGVGSGILVVPALMNLNIPPAVVLTTNVHRSLPPMIVDFFRALKSSSIDIPLSINLFAGGMFGSYLSSYLLQNSQSINWVQGTIAICYMIVLSIIAHTIAMETFPIIYRKYFSREENPTISSQEQSKFALRCQKFLNMLPGQRTFKKSGVTISVLVPPAIGFLAVSAFGITGINGGMIVIPSLTYLCGVSPDFAASASTTSGIFSMFLVLISSSIAKIDLHLSTIVFLSSIPGVKLGDIVARRVDGDNMRALFAASLIVIAALMLRSIIRAPTKLFSYNIIY